MAHETKDLHVSKLDPLWWFWHKGLEFLPYYTRQYLIKRHLLVNRPHAVDWTVTVSNWTLEYNSGSGQTREEIINQSLMTRASWSRVIDKRNRYHRPSNPPPALPLLYVLRDRVSIIVMVVRTAAIVNNLIKLNDHCIVVGIIPCIVSCDHPGFNVPEDCWQMNS